MTSTNDPQGDRPPLHTATHLVLDGRDTQMQQGFINAPVYRGSTVLYPTAEDFRAHRNEYHYGRQATPTTRALEQALISLEGPACAGVALTPSGLSAISTALLSVVQAGDHILVSDNVYRPIRVFCDSVLKRLGVATTYFDPLDGTGIAPLFETNTRAVFVETPGSQSMEMSDISAIAEIAHAHGATVLNDNTWATPIYYRSLDKGIDISIQSGTKYLGGHSDIMFGAIAANQKHWARVTETWRVMGVCVGPDDVFLALRGLRTLGIRLEHHARSALDIAQWLVKRPEVLRVLYPALTSDPGHALWQRDFTGASGLFSVVLKPVPEAAVNAFLNTLELFGMGYSWGGYESLAMPFDCTAYRTATQWNPGGPTIRFHVGLEDVNDLKADLERGFAALRAAA